MPFAQYFSKNLKKYKMLKTLAKDTSLSVEARRNHCA